MKCIKCNTDNKFKERTANKGKCKNCGHQFVFEPKQVASQVGFKFTDKFFADLISKISGENNLFFTEKQFLYLFDRFYQNQINVSSLFSDYVSVIVCSFLSLFILKQATLDIAEFRFYDSFKGIIGFSLFTFLALFFLKQIVEKKSPKKKSFALDKIKNLLNNWSSVNGKIERLIPPLESGINLNKINIPITNYSFDRLIVCEKDEIAQFLIANNFHIENNCAIVSINGYPQQIFNTVIERVKSNPDLKVYALHDVTPNGIQILNTLKTSYDWFANSKATIYDLGLLPYQIFKSKDIFITCSDESVLLGKQILNTIKDRLSAREIKWLESGKFIELESFSPQQLIQIVSLGISQNNISTTKDNYIEIYLDSSNSSPVTDIFFDKAIADISVNNLLFFTVKQFQYFLYRRLKKNRPPLNNVFEWPFIYIFLNLLATIFIGIFLSVFMGDLSSLITAYLTINIGLIINLLFTKNYSIRESNAWKLLITGSLIVGGSFFFRSSYDANILIIIIILALGITSIILGIKKIIDAKQIPNIFLYSQTEVDNLLNIWQIINGSLEKLLPPIPEESLPRKIDIDIAKYSFDRLIVCEKDEIAQFLIANNFHIEKNCAIVSINGYPQNIFNTVMLMVKSNPDLKIYALHDASLNGIKILDTLKTNSDWFGERNLVIYNLGLLPHQILKKKNLSIQQSNESAKLAKENLNAIENYLSDKEIKWLNSGKFIELESFRPQKLIQIVTLGINKSKVYNKTDSEPQIYLDNNISEGVTLELDTFG